MDNQTFNVYIDEAGDEGFKIDQNGNWLSSEWFVVGALIVRKTNDRELSQCINTIKEHPDFKKHSSKPVHFCRLDHMGKKFVLDTITKKGGFKCAYIAFDKRKVTDESFLKSHKGYLYNYCIRYLLERVSWLVDSYNGKAKLIFENRGNTSYPELNGYINELLSHPNNSIKKGVIQNWEILNKGQSKNLQIADTITSSLYKAVQKNKYGLVDDSYILDLYRYIYNSNSNYTSYGLKFFPATSNQALVSELPWLGYLQKFLLWYNAGNRHARDSNKVV